ncbi:hypothetical protein [Nitrosomonas communis]|uniref:Uncharacterized protein n=1 Tax=Nitrosomonas communis TaxID=44574 RepID=A0A1I4KYH4_9PROT|nr:hypothetical protein [Nitrosomonas communis]SFL83788.1 hypothetical protein SAMN05421863_100568 [Nitrosomonas communis]
MRAPIIVVEHGDVAIFNSAANAEIWLEPIDVKNGEYVAYDRDGRLLQLVIKLIEKPSFIGEVKSIESVKISGAEEGVNHVIALRKALINFFKKTEAYNQNDESLPLNELVNKAVNQYGYAK